VKECTVVITNKEGLHARPASLFTKAAAKYQSELKLIKNGDTGKSCNPKSIISILSLGVQKGDKLTIYADGQDEAEALKELQSLLEHGIDK